MTAEIVYHIRPSGAPLHTLSKLYDVPVGLFSYLYSPPPILRLNIAYFAVAEGWLLLDILSSICLVHIIIIYTMKRNLTIITVNFYRFECTLFIYFFQMFARKVKVGLFNTFLPLFRLGALGFLTLDTEACARPTFSFQ